MMNEGARILNSGHREGADFQGCSFCLLYKAGQCRDAQARDKPNEQTSAILPSVSRHTILARQMIHSPREFSDYVLCICAGQAVSSIALPDGRRQIIEILLPGDIVYWTVFVRADVGASHRGN